MTMEYRQSLTELNTIIHYMDIEYLKKLPQKFIEFINSNMDKDYIPNIDKNTPINEQNLKNDTKVLLSLLYRNYWCDREKKITLIQEDLVAKNNYEKELREKYNPDNIFKNKSNVAEMNKEPTKEEKHTELIEYKEQKWYQKIFAKILSIFKRS